MRILIGFVEWSRLSAIAGRACGVLRAGRHSLVCSLSITVAEATRRGIRQVFVGELNLRYSSELPPWYVLAKPSASYILAGFV